MDRDSNLTGIDYKAHKGGYRSQSLVDTNMLDEGTVANKANRGSYVFSASRGKFLCFWVVF